MSVEAGPSSAATAFAVTISFAGAVSWGTGVSPPMNFWNELNSSSSSTAGEGVASTSGCSATTSFAASLLALLASKRRLAQGPMTKIHKTPKKAPMAKDMGAAHAGSTLSSMLKFDAPLNKT